MYVVFSEATRSGRKFQNFKISSGSIPPDPLVWVCYCLLEFSSSDKKSYIKPGAHNDNEEEEEGEHESPT